MLQGDSEIAPPWPRRGLKFDVSEHLGASFTWFRTAHGADQAGPMKDVPYDGNDPQFQDL
jgi:alpha-L-fucosidase